MVPFFSRLKAFLQPARDDRPRVLLIGTSNAVFADGYAAALRTSSDFSDFHNVSIGLSSSFLFSYRCASIDFSIYDICILDFACNDASLMEDGYIDETLITSQLLEALSIITLAGCIPVILILPIARCMPTGGLTRKIYRDFCDLHNVAYFDLYNLIDLMRSHEIDTGDLFIDGMHIDKSFAYAAGEVLASSFKVLYERREKTPSRRKYTGFTHRFLSAELFQGSHDIVRRGTSLVSAVCVDFGPSVVSISVGDDEEIVAVVANFAYSKCCLELKGRNSITIRLSTDHYDSSNSSFTLGLWPLYPPIESWRSEVEMSVQSDRMSGVLCGEGPIVEGPGLASIIGFILRKPATLSVDPLFPHAVNLSRSFGEAFMAKVPVMRLKVLHAAIVDGLYRGLLKRPVDRVGLAHYANVISEQGFRKGIAESINSLMDSEEFKSRE